MEHITERRMVQEFACYYDLYVPEGNQPRPLVIATHGYGGDKKSMLRLTQRMIKQDCVIASLQGPHQHLVYPDQAKPLSFGFGWLTNFKSHESVGLHHTNVNQIINDLSAEGLIDRPQTFLIGFSQSVALNFRYAFTHPEKVRGVVGLFGGIPGDWESEGKYKAGDFDVLYLGGATDEFYTPDRMSENAEKLRQRARSVEFQVFDCGHIIPREADPVINEWIQKRNLPG